MRRTPRGGWISAGAALVLFLSTGGTTAWAQAPGAGSIHPRQFFVGTVNGLPSDAVIRVLCPGPVNRGHPLSGQTLEVNPPGPNAAHLGFTGAKARRIVANLTASGATARLAVFTRYGSAAAIPTSVDVPCGGQGLVSFDPAPGSGTAEAFDVTVTFMNLGEGALGDHATLPATTEKAAPQCTDGQVRVTADTDHRVSPPGRSVLMTSSIRNVSRSSCTFFLGAVAGWSPTFTVTNTGGAVVWDRCWVDDQPGACATVLRSYTLRPGERYHQEASWDQRSAADGRTPRQVPQGRYTFSTHFRYIDGTASAPFDILVG